VANHSTVSEPPPSKKAVTIIPSHLIPKCVEAVDRRSVEYYGVINIDNNSSTCRLSQNKCGKNGEGKFGGGEYKQSVKAASRSHSSHSQYPEVVKSGCQITREEIRSFYSTVNWRLRSAIAKNAHFDEKKPLTLLVVTIVLIRETEEKARGRNQESGDEEAALLSYLRPDAIELHALVRNARSTPSRSGFKAGRESAPRDRSSASRCRSARSSTSYHLGSDR